MSYYQLQANHMNNQEDWLLTTASICVVNRMLAPYGLTTNQLTLVDPTNKTSGSSHVGKGSKPGEDQVNFTLTFTI